MVEEKHPVKQGLRQHRRSTCIPLLQSRREASSKTRIKTIVANGYPFTFKSVEEKHPVKQGLRLRAFSPHQLTCQIVEEKHPVKQGLRLFRCL